jgi:hypothetical protein
MRRQAWTPFHSKLLQSLRREQVLPKHSRVLVAVSGGQVGQAGSMSESRSSQCVGCFARVVVESPTWSRQAGGAHGSLCAHAAHACCTSQCKR